MERGGISCLIHEQFGAKVHGVDISEEAVDVANARCDEQGFGEKVTFSVQDASKPLQFPDRDFDAVFCNDSIICPTPAGEKEQANNSLERTGDSAE